ncbi:MAG: HAMP domain-containing histidine kinase [Dehalococcoidia bacterium]|nr:HAMP domain-containing histidine kinase [Dehalococcoidia bacterium]
MRVPAFAKTIRFRLTLWYAALLLLFIILFIVGLNLTMEHFGPSGRFPHNPEIVRQIRIENQELLRNYSLIGLAGLVLFGAGGGYFLSRRMLKPVDRVSSLASRISSTNLKERINYQGPDDEMTRLANTFDDMLGRLESAFESQKQFIQDASHELRTPIAIAQTNIEVAEMEGKATARDYKRLMEVLKMSLERMNRLSDNLLLLSEGDQSQMKWSVVDMAALLDEVAAEAGAKATGASVNLELEPILEEMLVMGDALRLKQALINLVDNAIKYNQTGGTVKISARAEGSQLVLQVQDSGIGISAADQQRIFDRFYRVDKSRSRSQGGSGLGLAIVKKIVEDHSGTISVESTPGQGSTFRMSLPRHSPA